MSGYRNAFSSAGIEIVVTDLEQLVKNLFSQPSAEAQQIEENIALKQFSAAMNANSAACRETAEIKKKLSHYK